MILGNLCNLYARDCEAEGSLIGVYIVLELSHESCTVLHNKRCSDKQSSPISHKLQPQISRYLAVNRGYEGSHDSKHTQKIDSRDRWRSSLSGVFQCIFDPSVHRSDSQVV